MPCKVLIESELGMMVSDRRGSGAGVNVTVALPAAVTIEPSGFVTSTVITVVPAVTPDITRSPKAARSDQGNRWNTGRPLSLGRIGYIFFETCGSRSGKRDKLTGLAEPGHGLRAGNERYRCIFLRRSGVHIKCGRSRNRATARGIGIERDDGR